MPYVLGFDTLGTEMTYDSGDYAGLLDKALAAAGWDKLQHDLQRRRAGGETVGAGLAVFVEKSGLGPFDGVRVTVDTSGAVEVVTGAASIGQGVETVVAQICADALGRRLSPHQRRARPDRPHRLWHGRLRLARHGDDRRSHPYRRDESARQGACGRGLAVAIGAGDARYHRRQGGAQIRPRQGPSVTLGEIARALAPAAKLLGDALPGLSAEGWFESHHMTYPYGVHLAVVRVDRGSGATVVERYVVAYDIGKAVNPMLVEGQIAGGVAQGIGGALFEEFLYDARGEPLSVNFADYLMPTAREIPPIEVLITEDAPSPLNPLGLKGAGEGGVNPVGAAVAAAIDDALRMPGAVKELPVTPQRLRALLKLATARLTLICSSPPRRRWS